MVKFLAILAPIALGAALYVAPLSPAPKALAAPKATPVEEVPDIAGMIAEGLRNSGCEVEETAPREYALKACK